MSELPWEDQLRTFSGNPGMASREDVRRMAEELLDSRVRESQGGIRIHGLVAVEKVLENIAEELRIIRINYERR